MIIWWRISERAILIVSAWSWWSCKVYQEHDNNVTWWSVLLPGIAFDCGFVMLL